MKPSFLFLISCLMITAFAQSSVYIRNNTWHNFILTANNYGNTIISNSNWSLIENSIDPWVDNTKVFEVDRDAGILQPGEETFFDIMLIADDDTIKTRLHLIGTANESILEYSAAAPGFSDTWKTDGNFHEFQSTVGGKNVTIKYKPNNDDLTHNRDILFVIHDNPIYEIPEADFQNPNVLNIMAYNIQMLPFGVVGMPQADLRASLLPAQISPYQDVVVFEEVFDNGPRENNLEPAMLAAGFNYKTDILNNTSGLIPWNGGVIIFSRLPIEYSADFDFSKCGPNSSDCLANKGVKYARVNKLGKKYHVFGTHMDAGSAAADIEAKLSNAGEMRHFADMQNIPAEEPIVFGGDFNISPDRTDNIYNQIVDSLQPVIPDPIGYPNSTFSGNPGKVIDHVWGDKTHLAPLAATNEVITMRSIEDDMWELSEFSDHRTVLGRFVYPDIDKSGNTTVCPGSDLNLSVVVSPPASQQWLKNNNQISGEVRSQLSIDNISLSDSGSYQCLVKYSSVFGTSNNILVQYFFPDGPDTVQASVPVDFGKLNFDCNTGITDPFTDEESFIHPNPNSGEFYLNLKTEKFKQIEVFSLQGRLLYSGELGDVHRVSLNLCPGLYFVMLKNENRQMVEKLIVQ